MASAQPLDFADLAPKIAARLFDNPNKAMSTRTVLRFGTHGSMSVNLEDGQFYDHEKKQGGGMLALIQHVRGGDMASALSWLEEEGLKDRENRPAEVWQIDAHRTGPTFYDYRDETGAILSRVKRTPDKRFFQLGPDGKGGFHSVSGCMEGVRRVPYRLPELLAADPGRTVFVVEGEKDADRLATLGLVATCNAEGAGKFRPELVEHFAGRRLVVLADNDRPGQDHAADVMAKLTGTAAAVGILNLPGLSMKGDVSDWLDAGGGVDDLDRMAGEVLTGGNAEPETFQLADLSLWSRVPATPKAFVMAPFIPRDDVVIISGDGGTNKSTLALQISVCAAAGRQMLGMDLTQGPALYVTAEDDDRENHWRLAKIADAVGTTLAALDGRLHLASLRGRLNNELATFDNDGKLRPTQAYALLRATIEKTGAKLLTLDNVAHLFAGNENDRSQVTAFINLLYQLCGDFGLTILLIAHRNKAGDSYSGSTAWLNAVRSQVLIERSDENDADVRRLSLGKANYARQGEEVTFRWHDFALVRNEDLPASVTKEMDATIQATRDNDLFLTCLRQRISEQRAVSERRSPSFAPTVFATLPEAKGIGKRRLEAAMDRLFRLERIERAELWKGPDRKLVYGLRETAGNGAVNTVRATRETASEMAENRAGNAGRTHTVYKYTPGAATGAAAPDIDMGKVEFPPEPEDDRASLSRVMFPPESDDPAADFYDTDKRPRF